MSHEKLFPACCPKCEAAEGWPVKAQTAPGKMVVDMRCRACSHEWSEDMPATPLEAPAERLSKPPGTGLVH